MALLTHSGTGASDLSATNTKRNDISDVLFSSLYFENNILGLTTVGEEFVDQSLNWVEDSLNAYKVTDTVGFSATTVTTIGVSSADAAILDIGYVLQPDTKVGTGEYIQVVSLSGTTVGVTRGYGGSTAATTAASTVWRIVNSPTYENSDLGKDMTRARVAKTNYINRFELNVNLSNEQLIRARRGYAPGVSNELEYQFEQRKREMLRRIQQAYWFSITSGSTPASTGGDYSTMYGLYKWLDATANTTASPVTTAATFSISTVNSLVKNVLNQGAMPSVVVGPPNFIDDMSNLLSSQIRLTQSDDGRGFITRSFTPTVGGDLSLVMDFYLNNATGSGQIAVLDMNRIRIRPFAESFFFTVTAPTFRDGDAVRALSYLSLEVRNTGTDVGYAHQVQSGLTW